MPPHYPPIDWSKIQDSWLVNKTMDNTEDFPRDSLVAVTGFLRNDKKKLTARLYTSLDFNEYIEFKKADVQIIVPVAGPSNADTKALEPVTVWLLKSARVTRVERVRNETVDKFLSQDNFLVGEIVDLYLSTVTVGGLPVVKGQAGIISFVPPCSFGGCGDSKTSSCGDTSTTRTSSGTSC